MGMILIFSSVFSFVLNILAVFISDEFELEFFKASSHVHQVNSIQLVDVK